MAGARRSLACSLPMSRTQMRQPPRSLLLCLRCLHPLPDSFVLGNDPFLALPSSQCLWENGLGFLGVGGAGRDLMDFFLFVGKNMCHLNMFNCTVQWC